jgi:hypothetical protein
VWPFAAILCLCLTVGLVSGLAADESRTPIDRYVVEGLPGPKCREFALLDDVYRQIIVDLEKIDGPITIRIVRKPRTPRPKFSYYTDGPPDNPIIHGECYQIEVDGRGIGRYGVIRSPEYNSVDLRLDEDTNITDDFGYGMTAGDLRKGDIVTVWRDGKRAVKIMRMGRRTVE